MLRKGFRHSEEGLARTLAALEKLLSDPERLAIQSVWMHAKPIAERDGWKLYSDEDSADLFCYPQWQGFRVEAPKVGTRQRSYVAIWDGIRLEEIMQGHMHKLAKRAPEIYAWMLQVVAVEMTPEKYLSRHRAGGTP